MCTGDHSATAGAIAEQCGIYPRGPTTRVTIAEGLPVTQVDQKHISQIEVLARSSPEDKAKFVSSLQSEGRVVAFLGDGVNDRLALRRADLSFSLGMAGTEVTAQTSNVIPVDDDLDSIGTVIKTGKHLRDARAQLLESCFRTSIVLTVLTIISVVTSPIAEPALSPVQMLWITLLLSPFTVLSLAVPQSMEVSQAVLNDQTWLTQVRFELVAPATGSILHNCLLVEYGVDARSVQH